MRAPIARLVLFLGLLVPAAAGERVKVFIFAGQSNMVGADTRASDVDDFPPFVGAAGPIENVRFSYFVGDRVSDGWTHMQPVAGSFGPELTFARKIAPALDSPIAVIKCAVGGTTIAHDWNPDSPPEGRKLFRRATLHIQGALDALRADGVDYDLEAVFWHQGENDMLNGELVQDYAAGLTRFIAAVRDALDAPELPWYVGEISDKGIWGMDFRRNMRILREQQHRVVDADPLAHWVPTSHLAFEVMNSGQPHYHFGTQGQLQHGEAYAAAYLTAAGEVEPVTFLPFAVEPTRGTEPIRVFILLGGRNMEGEDAFTLELGPEDRAPSSTVRLRCSLGGGAYTSAGWEPLHAIAHLGNFGPELTFGRTLERELRASIAILKVTGGAAQISDWEPGAEDANRPIHGRALALVREALGDLERRGKSYTVEAVFWHGGENETWFAPFRARYAERLERVIAAFRRELELPELTWFVAEQSARAPWGEERIVDMNGGLRTLAKKDARVHMIATSDLPHERVHFGTAGTLAFGELLARAYLETSR